MSKIKLIHNIEKELKRLNNDIDLKIIRGLPYKAEARRHKFLLSQYQSIKNYNPFRKLFNAFASIVL